MACCVSWTLLPHAGDGGKVDCGTHGLAGAWGEGVRGDTMEPFRTATVDLLAEGALVCEEEGELWLCCGGGQQS